MWPPWCHSETVTTWAVIVAAGSGDRFGRPKQFEPLGDRRVVDWAIAAASEACDGAILVVPEGWTADDSACVAADAVVPGGRPRSDSVRAGLARVPKDAEVVVVHDAARPGAPVELFRRVIDAVAAGAEAAVPGLPVADTIKTVGSSDGGSVPGARRVNGTVDRSQLVAVQTPQAFRASSLRAVHADGGQATDDARLVEEAGGLVVVVPGLAEAHKITAPHDITLVAAMLGVDS